MSDFGEAMDTGAELAPALILATGGDYVVGRVVDYSVGYDEKWREDTYPIVILKLDEYRQDPPQKDQKPVETGDNVSIHIFSAMLERELAKIDPQIGERIGVVRMGKTKSKRSGREYTQYRVKVFGRKQAQGFMSARAMSRRASQVDREDRQASDQANLFDRPENRDSDDDRDDGLPF